MSHSASGSAVEPAERLGLLIGIAELVEELDLEASGKTLHRCSSTPQHFTANGGVEREQQKVQHQ